MSDLTILDQNNPAVAEFVESWRNMFEKSYDFSKTEDQATFYEGVMQMAKHVATTNATATLKTNVSSQAVSEIVIATTCVSSSS